ncbi:MAG: glycosyltransferase family 39 protein [Candidatus Promineofilum sp.]|nr:glycosyltransferase family 39 protein [Promineifilum sp.]
MTSPEFRPVAGRSARATALATGHRPLATVYWPLLALLILLLAAAFRLVALGDVPPGLAQDEVLDADIALFIRGGEHALFFRHGYGHEPLYHYLAAPFAPLLGDNWLAIRLPSVYLGLLLVALTMRWARRDYGTVAAVVAGLGLAISWWPVIFSRIGIRPILAPLLLVAAVWFWPLRRATVTQRGLWSAALAGFWLGLSTYSYTAARVAPLIPALMLLAFRRRITSFQPSHPPGRATAPPPPPPLLALWERAGATAPNSPTPPLSWPCPCSSTPPSP